MQSFPLSTAAGVQTDVFHEVYVPCSGLAHEAASASGSERV